MRGGKVSRSDDIKLRIRSSEALQLCGWRVPVYTQNLHSASASGSDVACGVISQVRSMGLEGPGGRATSASRRDADIWHSRSSICAYFTRAAPSGNKRHILSRSCHISAEAPGCSRPLLAQRRSRSTPWNIRNCSVSDNAGESRQSHDNGSCLPLQRSALIFQGRSPREQVQLSLMVCS